MRLRLALLALLLTTLCGCGGLNSGSDSSLGIQPSSVNLSPGETQTFSIVSARSSLVAVDSLRLRWSCAGGTFSMKNGLSAEFTAGWKSGSYTLVASDGKLSGSATVYIR